jgi:hypothetical protein
MRKLRIGAAVAVYLILTAGIFTTAALATGGPPEQVTICHVAGLASDPANHITLTLPVTAVYGPGGHFEENGTPQAGHEEDYLGPCNPPSPSPSPDPTEPPPVDYCPNIDGIQERVPPGMTIDPVTQECVPRSTPTPTPTFEPPMPGEQPKPEIDVDVCPNLGKVQEEVPDGFHKRDGNCYPDRERDDEGNVFAPPSSLAFTGPTDMVPMAVRGMLLAWFLGSSLIGLALRKRIR